MQRQLQLRIEAQGKYLKKIIEEQQRLSGVLSETPASEDNCLESKNITDPVTPVPAFETPIMETAAKECVQVKNTSVERGEPSTPDSGCHMDSPIENQLGERSMKKQRVGTSMSMSMGLNHQILESSMRSPFHQQQQSVYLTTEQFGHSSGINED